MKSPFDTDDFDTETRDETAEGKKWQIPSFLIRNYQFGYERECYEYFFGGEDKRGARSSSTTLLEDNDSDTQVIEIIIETKKQ